MPVLVIDRYKEFKTKLHKRFTILSYLYSIKNGYSDTLLNTCETQGSSLEIDIAIENLKTILNELKEWNIKYIDIQI